YDGERRNPWNEFECGSNYARSMASFALIHAFGGFEFDMTRGHIGFAPIQPKDGHFRTFWSLDSGWGLFEMTPDAYTLTVLQGKLTLHSLRLPETGATPSSAHLDQQSVDFSWASGTVDFASPVQIQAGKALICRRAG
ncbi:MAG: hypothetical protein KDD84_14260, partial [Caldilineaceae bacterium]|nr:hypothetical protein [Caldilineaceae bacterium]